MLVTERLKGKYPHTNNFWHPLTYFLRETDWMRILLQEFNSLFSSLKRNVTFIKQILTHCLINYRLHLQLAGHLQLRLQVEIYHFYKSFSYKFFSYKSGKIKYLLEVVMVRLILMFSGYMMKRKIDLNLAFSLCEKFLVRSFFWSVFFRIQS